MEIFRHINWRKVRIVTTITTAVATVFACAPSPVQPALNADGSVRVTAIPQEYPDSQSESFSGNTPQSEQNSTTSLDPRKNDPNYIYYPPMDTFYRIAPDPYSHLGSQNKCVSIGAGQTIWGATSVLTGDPAEFYDPTAISVTVYDATTDHNVIGSFSTLQNDESYKQIDSAQILEDTVVCNEGEIVSHTPNSTP